MALEQIDYIDGKKFRIYSIDIPVDEEQIFIHLKFLRDSPLTTLNICGIDVSSWQGAINWELVSNMAMVKRAYIRASGGINADVRFAENWAGGKKWGVARGGYLYWENEVDWKRQVDTFLAQFNGDWGEEAPCLDVEDMKPPLTAAELPDIRKALDEMERVTGKIPRLYTGVSVWAQFANEQWVTRYGLWQGQYNKGKYNQIPAWEQPTILQHTTKGLIPGITGYIDLDTWGDGVNPIVPLPYWKGILSDVFDKAKNTYPQIYKVTSLTNPVTFYDMPHGKAIKEMNVTWAMDVKSITADGWVKVHNDGKNDWWVEYGKVKDVSI